MFLWGAISCLRFEAISKVCGGSNLSTVLASWGIYIKMHFVGLNLSTDPKTAQSAEMHLQNPEKLQSQKTVPIRFDGLEQEKSLEISAFLVFSMLHLN